MDVNNATRDAFILTVTAYCEDSGGGRDGIRAVIHSIINRHNAKKWYSGKTIAACCLMAFQYSSWNTTDPNRVRVLSIDWDKDQVMAVVAEEVGLALSGVTNDPTNGATHYYAPKAVKEVPKWALPASGAIQTADIGGQLFFKNVA